MNTSPKNLKWEILFYFLAASVISAVSVFFGWFYLQNILNGINFWIGIAAILLVVGLTVGFFAALRLQRQLDVLHLGIIQLAKGNLAARVSASGSSLYRIALDFNEMASSLEQRIKLLQKVGEENVMLQAESNEAAVLEERKRLARDLHDTVSQQMFAIHMSASSLLRMVDGDLEQAKQVLDQLIHMSYHAQKQMRGLIAQLRPLELEGKSLSEALNKWFPDYCRQNGLQGSLDIRLQNGLSEAKEHQLFLIIQEGMANVVKHASAGHVELSLHETDNQYVLAIGDDGKGFDHDKVRRGSYGLSTMKERANKLGGDLDIFSKMGSGTRMHIHIPKFKDGDEGKGGNKE